MGDATRPREATASRGRSTNSLTHQLTNSLVSERHDRIQTGRAPRGPDAEQYADHGGEDERGDDRQWGDDRVPLEEGAHCGCASAADERADEATQQAEHDRLDEELQEDVAARRAECLPDPDLARPLRHR